MVLDDVPRLTCSRAASSRPSRCSRRSQVPPSAYGSSPPASASHYYALGRLLLAFTIFWAYAAFFQLLLIWIATSPKRSGVSICCARTAAGLVDELVVARAVRGPFRDPAQLPRSSGDGPAPRVVAIWILGAHYLDMHWLVAPEPSARALRSTGSILAALLAVVGARASRSCARLLRGRPFVPLNDPRLRRALRYQSYELHDKPTTARKRTSS